MKTYIRDEIIISKHNDNLIKTYDLQNIFYQIKEKNNLNVDALLNYAVTHSLNLTEKAITINLNDTNNEIIAKENFRKDLILNFKSVLDLNKYINKNLVLHTPKDFLSILNNELLSYNPTNKTSDIIINEISNSLVLPDKFPTSKIHSIRNNFNHLSHQNKIKI